MDEIIDMDELTIEELKEYIGEYSGILRELRETLEKKRVEEFGFSGKYLKIYGCNGDGPEYMKCEVCKSMTNVPGYANPRILFSGVGFSGTFGEYADSNYVDFSTQDDYYLDRDEYLRREELRGSGKTKPTDWDYNSYRVEVISEEEFREAFKRIQEQTRETFDTWMRED